MHCKRFFSLYGNNFSTCSSDYGTLAFCEKLSFTKMRRFRPRREPKKSCFGRQQTKVVDTVLGSNSRCGFQPQDGDLAASSFLIISFSLVHFGESIFLIVANERGFRHNLSCSVTADCWCCSRCRRCYRKMQVPAFPKKEARGVSALGRNP